MMIKLTPNQRKVLTEVIKEAFHEEREDSGNPRAIFILTRLLRQTQCTVLEQSMLTRECVLADLEALNKVTKKLALASKDV